MEFDSFLISFDALKLGDHTYRFLLDDEFFKSLEYSEIQKGNVIVEAVMNKSERLLRWELYFEGEVMVQCDRCGDEFSAEIDFEEDLVVKFGAEEDTDDGFIVLKQTAYQFDIAHYLFESINLSLPTRKIHPEVNGVPDCDKEVLKYFSNDSSEDSNDEEEDIDPRWAALKKLK